MILSTIEVSYFNVLKTVNTFPFLTLVCIISAEYHFKIPKGYFYDF